MGGGIAPSLLAFYSHQTYLQFLLTICDKDIRGNYISLSLGVWVSRGDSAGLYA